MDLAATLHSISRVFLSAALEVVPLFLLALLIGALIEEFVSERFIARFMTGNQPGTMLLASTVGALIPLCTCGMVPLAVALRRRGGDLKHTFGFLTAGAAVSIPVLLLTWRMIGLRWLVVRLVASVVMGLLVGYVSVLAMRRVSARSAQPTADGPRLGEAEIQGQGYELTPIRGRSRLQSVRRGFLGQLREYAPWILVSLALAAFVDVLVPGHWIHVLYGQRTTLGTLLASVSGIPFYFCSGAELPLVKELLGKGMGSGPATAMMLAVPIVNIPTFGVVSRWLGPRASLQYLGLCAAVSAIIGAVAGGL